MNYFLDVTILKRDILRCLSLLIDLYMWTFRMPISINSDFQRRTFGWRPSGHLRRQSLAVPASVNQRGCLLKSFYASGPRVGAPPRYFPDHQLSSDHAVGYDAQGINQPMASALCHIVSPLPPSSFSHLDIVSTMELLHTRKGVSSPTH